MRHTHHDLVGMPDDELLKLAPEATHQHRKGGLYVDLGAPTDGETRGTLTNADGKPMHGWLHVYPHERGLWIRREEETEKYRPLARHD